MKATEEVISPMTEEGFDNNKKRKATAMDDNLADNDKKMSAANDNKNVQNNNNDRAGFTSFLSHPEVNVVGASNFVRLPVVFFIVFHSTTCEIYRIF